MTPKVDTFQHDIAEEIKRKDASYTEMVAKAVEGVDKKKDMVVKKPAPVLLIVLIFFFTCGLSGLIGLAYFYFTDSLLPPSQKSVEVTPSDIPKVAAPLEVLSPTLHMEIGRYVTAVEKQTNGYIISINSYSPVFAYMARNEDLYIEELASVISPPKIATTSPSAVEPKATTTPVVAPVIATTTTGTTTKTTATSTATSTQPKTATTTPKAKIATTTKSTKTSTTTLSTTTTTPMFVIATSSTIVAASTSPFFKDVTITNQNMRVWKKGDQMVVYAFITTDKIAIASSTEAILALKSAIIR